MYDAAHDNALLCAARTLPRDWLHAIACRDAGNAWHQALEHLAARLAHPSRDALNIAAGSTAAGALVYVVGGQGVVASQLAALLQGEKEGEYGRREHEGGASALRVLQAHGGCALTAALANQIAAAAGVQVATEADLASWGQSAGADMGAGRHVAVLVCPAVCSSQLRLGQLASAMTQVHVSLLVLLLACC
jgi:hypothetical protein